MMLGKSAQALVPVTQTFVGPSGATKALGGACKVFALRALLVLLIALPVISFAQSSVVSTDLRVLRDPIHNASDPYLIPGAEVRYIITIEGPDATQDSAYRALVLTDNISDDMAIADTVTDSAGQPESGCVVGDFILLKVVSQRAGRAGVFCLSQADAPGVSVSGSNGSSFGENITLNFSAIPNVDVLPADATAVPPRLKGDLLPDEQLIVEFNAVLR